MSKWSEVDAEIHDCPICGKTHKDTMLLDKDLNVVWNPTCGSDKVEISFAQDAADNYRKYWENDTRAVGRLDVRPGGLI